MMKFSLQIWGYTKILEKGSYPHFASYPHQKVAKFKQKWFIHKIIHIIHNEFLDIMQLLQKTATNECFVKNYHKKEKAPKLGAF